MYLDRYTDALSSVFNRNNKKPAISPRYVFTLLTTAYNDRLENNK